MEKVGTNRADCYKESNSLSGTRPAVENANTCVSHLQALPQSMTDYAEHADVKTRVTPDRANCP